MSALDSAGDTILRALRTNQIGTPVAARLIVHTTQDHGQIEHLASVALDTAAQWFGGRPHLLYAQGGAEDGQITAALRWEGGQMALVSAGVCGTGGPLLEALVFGNHGILSWEANGGLVLGNGMGRAGQEQRGHVGLEDLRVGLESREAISIEESGVVTRHSVAGSTQGTAIDPFPTQSTPLRLPAKRPYGVLLVAGDHTHQPGYAEALAADERCRLVALTDTSDVPQRRGDLNQRLADQLGIPLLPDLDAALARTDIAIASICAEPFRRGDIAVRAARAGKHLYMDKPLAGSNEDAQAIANAVREAGVVGHMFSQVHFGPAQQVRELVNSGTLGQIVAVHCDLCFAKGQAGTAELDRTRRESSRPDRYELQDSKRELTNVGVYCLVMLLWALRRRVRRVFGATGNYFFAEHQRNDMEDFGQIMMELEGGITASISAGRAGWQCHPDSGVNRTYLIGTKATAVIDAHRPRLEIWSDVPSWQPPPRDPEDPMGMWAAMPDSPFRAEPKLSWLTPGSASWKIDAEHFLNCLENGRQSEVSLDLAAAATAALLAAYQSAAEGCAVEL